MPEEQSDNPFIAKAQAEGQELVGPDPDKSARAKELVAQGKIGGREFGKLGGRPRKRRAAEVAAEEAKVKAKEIVKVFEDAIDEEQPMKIRLEGAKGWLDLERKEAELQLEEEKQFDKADKEQLAEFILEKLQSGGPVAELLAAQLGAKAEIVDAEVVE